MRPTKLVLRGLKCWSDSELDIAPLTAIQGPNGSGKTAWLQGIRLALIGHDPEVGKRLQETRTLVDEERGSAEIGLSFDTGFGIRRIFGAKSETHVMPSEGETTGAAAQARIDTETGGLVVALDLESFFGLSDEKRREWLFEHLPRDAAALDFETFSTWTDLEESEVGSVATTLWEHNVQKAANPVTGLGSAINVAHSHHLEADRARQAQEKVVARGEEKLRAAGDAPEVDVAKIEELGETLAGLNQRIGEARQGREAAEAIAARVQRGEDELGELRRKIEHVAAVLFDLEEQLDEANEVADGHKTKTNLEAQLDAAAAEVARLGRVRAEINDELAGLATRIELGARVLRVVEEGGVCPYAELGCETDLDALREPRLAELRALTDDHLQEKAAADARDEALSEELAEITVERDRLRREIDTIAAAETKRADLVRAIETKETSLVELKERIELREADHGAAVEDLAGVEDDATLSGLYEERDEAERARRSLLSAKEAAAAYAATEAAHRSEVERCGTLQAKAVALKELAGNLRRLRAHVIEKMIEPLVADADEILRAMDPAKTFRVIFERENRATMDFGFEEAGKLRLFGAASKGERVMLTVAFLGAILTVVAPPMRLLMIDDVEQLDEVRRRRLMEALAGLSGRWDAVLLAGACDMGGVDEWELVDLTPAEVVA